MCLLLSVEATLSNIIRTKATRKYDDFVPYFYEERTMGEFEKILKKWNIFSIDSLTKELNEKRVKKYIPSHQSFTEDFIGIFNRGLTSYESNKEIKVINQTVSKSYQKAKKYNLPPILLIFILEKYIVIIEKIINNLELPGTQKEALSNVSREFHEMLETKIILKISEKSGAAKKGIKILESSYDQIKSILEFLPDATFAIDMQRTVIAWNKRMEEITGITKEEIIGKNGYEYAIPFYGERCCTLIDFLNDSGCELEKGRYNNFRRVGGTIYAETFAPNLNKGKGAHLWLNASILYDGQKNRVGSIESIREISHIKKAQEDLERSERRFRFLAENASDIIYLYRISPEKKLEYLSPSFEKIIGYSTTNYQDDPSFAAKLIYPEHEERIIKMADESADFSAPLTYRIIKKDGNQVWLEHLHHPIFEKGKFVGVMGIARNITLRREMEERIKYMGFHDTLTGLYNRRFFEEQLEHFSAGRKYPIGLIIFDVNGLKIVNDSFGHSVGDQMLVAAANALNNSFRKEDIIARIGGDEFAVLLTGCDNSIIEETLKRVDENLKKIDISNIRLPLSISYGFALKMDKKMSASSFFKEADDMMYKKKILEKKSSRDIIINSLANMVEKKKSVNILNSRKNLVLVKSIAKELGFSTKQEEALLLLAKFHDVGYVAIDSSLLSKCGTLSREEIKEIRRHTETGYRISAVTNELNEISDWILKHHEWWNGNGYPSGLKGKEIPLEARIISIIAAFISMTTDKPYRKAFDCDKALQEIEDKSGIQFDPELVQKLLPILKNFCI